MMSDIVEACDSNLTSLCIQQVKAEDLAFTFYIVESANITLGRDPRSDCPTALEGFKAAMGTKYLESASFLVIGPSICLYDSTLVQGGNKEELLRTGLPNAFA